MTMPDGPLALPGFRARFPIFRERVYLNSCSQGALSIDVEAALGAWLDTWRTKGSPWDEWMGEVEALRAAFAAAIGASAAEVAVLPSASVAADVVARALTWTPDRPAVVVTEFEFPTMGHVWLAQQRRGAEVRWARARHGDMALPAFDAVIDDRTHVVAAAHVCYRNGYRLDAAGLARLCQRHGALFVLDDYQQTGTAPLDVRALGVDVLVTGALKYLIGPPGVAFLYVRRELIDHFEPTVTGWFGRAHPFAFRPDVLDWAPDAHRFENGTPPVPNVYAARAGLDLLARVGPQVIGREVARLTSRFMAAVRAEGWAAHTPADPTHRGPLCVVRSHDASELARRLSARGVIVSSRADGLRVSFHAYNNDDDIDAVIGALRAEASLIERDS
jgi:selenocysteine lyase/cysteine desulfurase